MTVTDARPSAASTVRRNATLADLQAVLTDQHGRKVDVIAPSSQLRARDGRLVISGAEPVVDGDGVTCADGTYLPTAVCDEGVADKLGIPAGYVKRLRADRPDLYDANVNGWLHGVTGDFALPGGPPDDRRFLVRCFRGDGGEGVARAFLSDRYRIVDNLDFLVAALDGVRQAGADVTVESCDLSDRRMYVRIVAPSVRALAPTLLRDYRSPFRDPSVRRAGGHTPLTGDAAPDGSPIVFAGFVISNSETGGGAFSIVPRLVVQACSNGLCVTKDAIRGVHLGGQLEEGVVRASEDTTRKMLALITARTRDAVATFLDTGYMTRVIAEIEGRSTAPVHSPDVVRQVGKELAYDKATIDGVLEHFTRAGDMTAGGVMHAVTSFAQTVPGADEAYELEASALRALALAAA